MIYITTVEDKAVFDNQYRFRVYQDKVHYQNIIVSGLDTLENIKHEFSYWIDKIKA